MTRSVDWGMVGWWGGGVEGGAGWEGIEVPCPVHPIVFSLLCCHAPGRIIITKETGKGRGNNKIKFKKKPSK